MTADLSFLRGPCPEAARTLVGKMLCRRFPDGRIIKLRICETEAYCGESDTACHAHRGRTARTEVMYSDAGTLYVYLCYGIHWMLNIVTGERGDPQAVLIRACEGAEGPGRLTKALGIDRSFNGKALSDCGDALWIEDVPLADVQVSASARIGIGYASPEDQAKLWRYILQR